MDSVNFWKTFPNPLNHSTSMWSASRSYVADRSNENRNGSVCGARFIQRFKAYVLFKDLIQHFLFFFFIEGRLFFTKSFPAGRALKHTVAIKDARYRLIRIIPGWCSFRCVIATMPFPAVSCRHAFNMQTPQTKHGKQYRAHTLLALPQTNPNWTGRRPVSLLSRRLPQNKQVLNLLSRR